MKINAPQGGEQLAETQGKTLETPVGGAPNGARFHFAAADDGLQHIAELWPALTPANRAVVVALVNALADGQTADVDFGGPGAEA